MSETSRQRFLRIKNMLEEFEWKYGPLEKPPKPDWLDTLDGWYAMQARLSAGDTERPVAPMPPPATPVAPPAPPARPTRPVARPAKPRAADW